MVIETWLRRKDPELAALHKAIKVAVIVPAGLAIGMAVGDTQMALFASFGAIAMLLFADFPGGPRQQAASYVGLIVVGAVLIVAGSLVSNHTVAAVVGMLIVGFAVEFAGVLSAASAGATRALLLAFVLPVTIRDPLSEIPSRLAGWGIAAVIVVPTALLIWPPRDDDRLRDKAADACRAMARQLRGGAESPATAAQQTQAAVDALRTQFRSTTFRPVGLTSGSRLLMQVPDRLDWLRAVIGRAPAAGAQPWPEPAEGLRQASVEVLDGCANVLSQPRGRSRDALEALGGSLAALDAKRAAADDFVRALDAESHPADQPDDAPSPALVHELAYTTQLTGHGIATSAMADARSLLDRLIGRNIPSSIDGPFVAAGRIAVGHTTVRSVWFQNSVRGAVGLAFAVLLAEITHVSHGFWIVLAAMSVLRTTALSTGSNALRALVGTVIGFVVGALVLHVLGTTAWHLWLILPIVTLFAAYLPAVISFAAGQFAFTVLVLIEFNILAPSGWKVGVVRIEDVAIGAAAGLVSGILLWPRGAAAQIRAALSDHYRHSAHAVRIATAWATGVEPIGKAEVDAAIVDSRHSGYRLDDALREYLFERGSKPMSLSGLTSMSNGANRLRLAAEAIGAMKAPGGDELSAPAGRAVADSADATAQWYVGFSDVVRLPRQKRRAEDVPAIDQLHSEQAVLSYFAGHRDVLADEGVSAHARTLWATSLYVDGTSRVRPFVAAAATQAS